MCKIVSFSLSSQQKWSDPESGIRDPGSGKKPVPDPGVKRAPDPDPQHCFTPKIRNTENRYTLLADSLGYEQQHEHPLGDRAQEEWKVDQRAPLPHDGPHHRRDSGHPQAGHHRALQQHDGRHRRGGPFDRPQNSPLEVQQVDDVTSGFHVGYCGCQRQHNLRLARGTD